MLPVISSLDFSNLNFSAGERFPFKNLQFVQVYFPPDIEGIG